jgi:hypothetical protein
VEPALSAGGVQVSRQLDVQPGARAIVLRHHLGLDADHVAAAPAAPDRDALLHEEVGASLSSLLIRGFLVAVMIVARWGNRANSRDGYSLCKG